MKAILLINRFFYRLGLGGYWLGLKIASFVNPKAKLWLVGRQDIWRKLKTDFNKNKSPVSWVHCASLGEFEQGRPLIEALKKQAPEQKILLTFFSPSGYEICKNYALADWVYYLPLDSPKTAKKWIEITAPQQVFFVKYEYWYYYLKILQNEKIATYIISAIFRPKQIFFKPYGGLFREMLACFTQIFVQDSHSLKLLKTIGIEKVKVVGDTRLDRVLSISRKAKNLPLIADFCATNLVLVAGSTWAADETILAEFARLNTAYRLIIAPHEIAEKHLKEIENKFSIFAPIRYSSLSKQTKIAAINRVLIIDNIGLLSQIYHYGTVAYIGGGFGAGIHNTLEAAVYYIPVLFGSNYQKFKEAKDLIAAQTAFEIKEARDILKITTALLEVDYSKEIAKKSQKYFEKHGGATAQILENI